MPSVEYIFERLCKSHRICVPNPCNSYFVHFATSYIESCQPLLMDWEEKLKLFKSTVIVKIRQTERKKAHPPPILIDMMPNDPEKKNKKKTIFKGRNRSDCENDGLTERKSNSAPSTPSDDLEIKRRIITNNLKNVRETQLIMRTTPNLHQVLQQFKSRYY